jgi:hypothetical protein
MSDREGKSPAEKLDDLYKWLLTPTTFLLLISWNITTYVVTTALQHDELNRLFEPRVSVQDLLLAPRLTIYAGGLFVLSVLGFLIVTMIRRWKIAAWFRFPSYFLLILSMIVIGFSFIWASEPFRRLPGLSGLELMLVILASSGSLSIWIICWAYQVDRT